MTTRFRFPREMVLRARLAQGTLFALETREHGGPSITMHGLADEETEPIVKAFLKWTIKRDKESHAALLKAVRKVKYP